MSYTDALRIVIKGSIMLISDYDMGKDAMLEYTEALRVMLQRAEQETEAHDG